MIKLARCVKCGFYPFLIKGDDGRYCYACSCGTGTLECCVLECLVDEWNRLNVSNPD